MKCLLLVAASLALLLPASARGQTTTSSGPSTPLRNDISYVPGSSQKICQLTEEMDRQLGVPTLNQTETLWGLEGVDLGYSFEHDGKLFFLFGDAHPTPTFNGKSQSAERPAAPSCR